MMTCGLFAYADATNTPLKGVIRVKLQPQVATEVGITPRVAEKGLFSTGVQALDISAQKIKAKSIRRVFPYSPKYESQMAEYGLDRWYEVTFDENINPHEAQHIFSQTAGVQVATCKTPMVLKEGNGTFQTVKAQSTSRPSAMPFNDPRLPNQWHYNNTGSLSGSKAGADINLFEAWKTTTGNKDVIVAIIDGGIDYTHEDLATNVAVNEAEFNGIAGADDDGNGYIDDIYGWNFCTNNKDIYPHPHGTHVAGTIAAVNNNGIGVCGIAGGDGSANSGVSMISVQVFDSRSGSGEGDFAAAIVYAANRGASIANCSWGWASDNYYEQDVLDAIDYFVSKTRSDNLVGGVMFFATGNDGVTGKFYPAYYDKVVAVGAMTCDYTVASYSNYGEWVDIVAPGGLLDYGEAGGVLSTLPNNEYGFNEGTSMATPHVTGIAALVLSQHGKADLPAETLRQQILTSVNDLYIHNAGREGLHGAGYIDAAKALVMGDGTAPEAVASFTALPAQDEITIEWTIPASSDNNVNYHMLYYSTETFDATTDFSTLQSVVIDTKFLSSGDSHSYALTGLSPMTTYYLALKAVNRWGNSSALSPIVTATTNAGPKMTVDKTSLSLTIDASASSIGSTTFNIGNEDEGLLKWSGKIATKSYTTSTQALSKRPIPGTLKALNGKLGVTPHSATETFNTAEYIADEYPKSFKYYKEFWASIGESDKTLPNSQAQWFYVDPTEFPNGFNLTNVAITSTYGNDPTIQIYNGSGSINSASFLQEVKPSYFYSDYQVPLTEQIHFAAGESFWVVVHFPAESNQDNYPLGLANADATYGSYSFMSNDMGQTWTVLPEALKGSPYEVMGNEVSWAITAISKNPEWDQLFTLEPAIGTVKQGELQSVKLINDGQKLINGTYRFNISFTTNESEKNTIIVPTTVTVKNNNPEMSPAKVVNFGSLLIGETKELTVTVFNEGYGNFTGEYGYLQSYNGGYTSSSEHFVINDVPYQGFPARATSSFKVSYAPQSAGSHTGTITFKNVNGIEFKVTLQGVATDPSKIVILPDTIEAGILDVDSATITKEFTIKNDGSYPLEYVFPKFSNQQLENQGKAAHKFGYSALTNLNGATDFVYDGNPALIEATDITNQFDDNTYLSKAIDLGFEFPFYGKNYDKIYITSYGGVAFNTGEYSYRSPLSESAYGIEGVAYISAYGYQLAIAPNSKIEYANQDGKFVINFSNVMGLVYDQEYTPISFRITLSTNGDIEIFYDNYDPMSMNLFQSGSTLFCGLKDENGEDPLVITSTDIADYWGNNEDPAGDVYMQFTHQSSVKFVAPKANFVTDLNPAYGIVNPGESTTITATLKSNSDMIAGATYNNLVVMSNDPQNGTSYVRINAVITGSTLLPEAKLASEAVDFGKVFRTSIAQKPVTIKNSGKDTLTVSNITLTSGTFSYEVATPFTIPAGMSKDIILTLPTENEGVVSDIITIVTDAGTLTATIKGEVIGCPTIDLSYNEISDTIDSGIELIKPLTITNNGNEPLVYSITPNPEYIAFADSVTEGAKVSYSYVASIDDKAVKYEWIDIETTGLGEQNNFTYYNNHDFVTVELPFAFPYYGKEYTKMYIYNTGFISFTERDDQKIWPEPPAEFPNGTVYTNIIAPYWGLHTMDTSKSAGTYHYVTEDEVIVSWMEYGNTMNLGVCYQLIMKKDGSFKFQYKGYGDYAIIYGIFGLAGLSNEDGSIGIKLPERYVAFGNAVQFYPVVQASIDSKGSKTIDIEVLTNKMGGQYNSSIVINSNVPGKEKIEIPLNLTINGVAKPIFPTDSIIIERVIGHMDPPEAGPITAMGVNYEAYFKIENQGTATFTIHNVKNGGPGYESEDWWTGEMMWYPLFQTWYNGPELDWMTGEPTGNYMWQQYYDNTTFTVDKNGAEFSIPMSDYSLVYTPGVYDVPLTFYYSTEKEFTELDSAVVNIRFIVTPAPAVSLDKAEIRVTNAETGYVGTDSVVISNVGEYKLTYELRLDPTGKGEEVEENIGGGIAPMTETVTLNAEKETILRNNFNNEITPLEVSSDSLNIYDAPSDFAYNRTLYYPSNANSPAYSYGAGNTYGEYKAATYYVAPEDGFNISHIYIATTLSNINGSTITNADYYVEIINGNDYENGDVLGKGSFHIDEMAGANFVVIPLDRSVYMNPGQDFYVVVTYPIGVEYPAYLSLKEESVVSNRYMGYVEGYGWFDIATMFKDQIGSAGYIMSCLETTPGAAWVKMLNADSDKAGTIAPGESLNVKFQLSEADAPLVKNNKAVLVIKSNDPAQKVINFPIYLDKNAAPAITTPEEIIYAKEGETTLLEVIVSEPENESYIVRFNDSGNMSAIQSASTIDASDATIDIDKNANVVSIDSATSEVKVVVAITPEFGSNGSYTLTFSAADRASHESQAVVRYYVEHVNRAPIAIEYETVKVALGGTSQVVSFADMFIDPDGDDMTFSMDIADEGFVTAYTSGSNVIFVGEATGIITVTVTATDVNGASTTTTFDVEVAEVDGVNSISIDTEICVYPNPVVETIYVTCGFNANAVNYTIYNENGAVVYDEKATSVMGETKSINVANFANGIYFLKVTAENGKSATIPVIKQ